MRWWPVFLRNLLVWRKLAIPSLVGNIAEPLMWLVAFGYGMGALVGEVTLPGVEGMVKVPYILFLASGSICMSAMNAASFEALYSAFSRIGLTKTGKRQEKFVLKRISEPVIVHILDTVFRISGV